MIAQECSEQGTYQLRWACGQCRPMLEVIETGLSRPSERWSAVSLETPLLDPYYSGGSSRLRCSSSTTCCRPASFRFSTTYSSGVPSWRLCIGSQRDSSSVPLFGDDRVAALRGQGPPKGPGSSWEYSTADAETFMPGPGALRFSGGAPD